MVTMQIKRVVVGVSALLGVGLLSVSARAQEGAPAPAQNPGQGQGRGGGQRRGGINPRAMTQAFSAVNPTAEQTQKMRDLAAKMREDQKGLQSLQGRERREKAMEMNRKFVTDVEALLTPEQKTKFQEELKKAQAEGPGANGGGLMAALEPLNLTAEQKTKVEPIAKETQEQLAKLRTDQNLQGQARTDKMTQIVDDMRAKVRPLLTPEQQTKFDELRINAGGGGGGRRNRQNGGGN